MRISALGIDIPDKPTDGYILKWWRLEDLEISHVRWQFYEDMSYSEYCGDPKTKGAPLIHDWMTGDGRMHGWEAAVNIGTYDEYSKIFLNHEDAKAELLIRLEKELARRRKSLLDAERHLAFWTGGLVHCLDCHTPDQELLTSYQKCTNCGRYVSWGGPS